MNMIKFFLIGLVVLFMSGCAQKVQIRALAPAKVGEMANNKTVAVSKFKSDKVGLSGKIESKIASHKLDRKKYFKVVSRKDIDKVLKEQKLQSSELMDEKTTTRVGKIVGAQAIINGEVTTASGKSGSYKEKRKRCKKYDKKAKECVKYEYYIVRCNTTEATVAANINIVGVESASVIYGNSFRKSYQADSCRTFRRVLSTNEAIESLSASIANEFVGNLTPKYIYFKVELLDEIEFDASSKQEKKLENALKYIEANRMDKAEEILNVLLDEFDGRSYVIAYDLGVVKEARGKFDEAKNMYSLADEISTEPIEELNNALIRIDDLISKRDEAIRQIDAK
ncbi:MAG: CsgG/HfaB family protein [Thiovulaceae bacterium]|nr:CsgG/HfaB family protein [Sulfurimonadaceae bacterium]MCW9027258.1 CsgG/HfaB family protein [Sulfurimonadaceae bacterium]